MAIMMEATHDQTGLPARALRIWVVVWALLASLALSYLALLTLRPELAAALLGGPASTAPDGNRVQRAAARALAEVDELRRTLARLEKEIGDERETAATRELKKQALMARVAALEANAASRGAEAGAAQPQRAAVTTPADAARATAPDSRLVGVAVQGTIEEQGARPAPQATATAPPAATTAKPGSPVAVQLATGPSVDALRLAWLLLQEGHRATLRSLEPRWVEVPGDPASFALIAGPVSDAEAANKLCDRPKSRRISCNVAVLGGKPL
jgi:hypothetical protein